MRQRLTTTFKAALLVFGALIVFFTILHWTNNVVLFRNPDAVSCLNAGGGAGPYAPTLPATSARQTQLTQDERRATSLGRQIFGKEFVSAELAPASGRVMSTPEEERTWINVYIKNQETFPKRSQKEHWNPGIRTFSTAFLSRNNPIEGLHFAMFYEQKLTYWLHVDKSDLPKIRSGQAHIGRIGTYDTC